MRCSIKAALVGFIFFACSTFLIYSASQAAQPSYGYPVVVEPAAKYLVFFHNYYVETKGTEGDCKYYDLLTSFSGHGFNVISEIRPKDASAVDYAAKAAAEIRKLLEAGVAEGNITVAGHSKGGVIAIRVASLLQRSKINYVILAGCGIKSLAKAYPDFSNLKGQFLSVYASSDTVAGSCQGSFAQAKEGFAGKEITLDSQAGHQLFFRPSSLWLEPTMAWLRNN